MFGERYFATRERLSAVMRGIDSLAKEVGSEVHDNLPLAEIERGLGAPFLFVICGEVNAGKSTLINGLFGRELCRANILPETDRVLWYQHGDLARDVEITPMLEERHRPVEFLRDFNLIDTPGTNSVVQGHQEITARFLPSADLILFVFPVTNPWGAATWNFLSELTPETLDRVVFVIQQADQRDPIDLEVIIDHMADLAAKRIGRKPPVFAVSGKMAFEAKRALPPDEERLKASGYPVFESFISKKICDSPERRSALETWRNQAGAALRKVEDCMEDQTRTLNTQDRFLDAIEGEIAEIRERFVARLPKHLAGVAAIFESEAVEVSKMVARKLRVGPSFMRLFTGDRTGPEIEAEFARRLQAAVDAVADEDGCEVVDVCREHWNGLVDRVKNAMAVDMGGIGALSETMSVAKKHFLLRLNNAAREGIGNLKVRTQLDKDLRHRDIALKSFVFMTLLLTTVGASCGALGLPWLPQILCGLAGMFLLGGVIAAMTTAKTIRAEFLQRLNETCAGFANTLRTDYEEALRVIFKDYATTLGTVRSHLAREKQAIEPRLRRWQELFLTLKAIEQEF